MWQTTETISCTGAGNKARQLHSWLLSTESGGVSRLTELFLPFCPYRDLSNNRIGCLSPEMFLDLSSLSKLWVLRWPETRSSLHCRIQASCARLWMLLKTDVFCRFCFAKTTVCEKNKLFKGGTEKRTIFWWLIWFHAHSLWLFNALKTTNDEAVFIYFFKKNGCQLIQDLEMIWTFPKTINEWEQFINASMQKHNFSSPQGLSDVWLPLEPAGSDTRST